MLKGKWLPLLSLDQGFREEQFLFEGSCHVRSLLLLYKNFARATDASVVQWWS